MERAEGAAVMSDQRNGERARFGGLDWTSSSGDSWEWGSDTPPKTAIDSHALRHPPLTHDDDATAAPHLLYPPSDEACATSHAARVALFANQIARAGPGSGYEDIILGQAMCHGCGLNTGNWCTPCAEVGRSYYTYGGAPMRGAPLCTSCERAAESGGRQCRVCTGEVLAPLRRVILPPILDLHL